MVSWWLLFWSEGHRLLGDQLLHMTILYSYSEVFTYIGPLPEESAQAGAGWGRCEMLQLSLLHVCMSLRDLCSTAGAMILCGYPLGQDDQGKRFGMAASVGQIAKGV